MKFEVYLWQQRFEAKQTDISNPKVSLQSIDFEFVKH